MADIDEAIVDKVVKGLECCWASFPRLKGCPVCPYEKICYHDKACNELLRDALKLLSIEANMDPTWKAENTLRMAKQLIEQKLGVPIINMIRSMESCISVSESLYGKDTVGIQITNYDAQNILKVLYELEIGRIVKRE